MPNPALHKASIFGKEDIVALLLEAGAEPNCCCKSETGVRDVTPLHFAAHAGHVQVVELLLAKGADPERKCAGGLWDGQRPEDIAGQSRYAPPRSRELVEKAIRDAKSAASAS